MANEARFELSTGAALTDAALRSAVDAAPDGILVVDEAGTIVFVNPMTERLFKYERDELVGQSVDQLLPVAMQATHAARRAAYMEHPRTRAMGSGLDLRGRQRSGTEFPVEISLSPVQSGERTLVIAIVRDVSERRETDEELTRTRSALALSDERERIARDLHDTVIQRLFAVGLSLQATLTRGDPAPERIRQAVDDIDDTIRDLRSTIFALHARRAGSASVRDDVIAIAHEAARALGFEPSVAFDGTVDSAATDLMHEHLVSALREALSNVARHARASSVRVDVAVRQNHLLLCVSDDGTGIGDEIGQGNGLANMRERAESLGGSFEVNSPAGGGARLEWRVPVSKALKAGEDDA
jgi:two-component system, NarL family, sensor histidine kinase DevS